MTKDRSYDSQSISSLKGADRVRKRPGVIFGSDGIEGCEHSFFEILSNAIDEHREGYGNIINVEVFNDGSIAVEDFGRGVPLGWNESEKKYNWELVFCELYAGGKYKNAIGGAYEYSLGLNGLGACATQYASEYMDVISFYGGEKHTISFKQGEPIGKLESVAGPKTKTGTYIKWRPDREVFTETNLSKEFFTEILLKQAVVNSGLTLKLKFQNPDNSYFEAEYFYKNGIVDYINEKVGKSAIMPVAEYSAEREGRDREDKDDYKLKINFAFTFSNEVNFIEYYHNSSFLEHGGSPERATRSAFVYAIDKYLKATNKYNKREAKINFSDIEDSLVLVTNSFSTQTSYANQTKKAITNTFIARAMTDFFKHSLEVYFAENPQFADAICSQILVNKRSRESAETMRTNVKKRLSGTLDINNSVEKFVGCHSKDPSIREIYIVEGDSALTSCKLARDSEFQAIMPVRGKTLNCLKSSYDRIFKNDIIMDLLKVIGCGVEIKSNKNKNLVPFDMSLLKWDKIIICTDADEDGYQIRTLILTMFYRLLPTLIREGKIYIAQTPLYEITTKDKTFFAYDEQEKNNYLQKIGEQKHSIQRSKGLGQNDPEMMSLTTMSPTSRRLLQITPEDEKSTAEMFEILLGDSVAERRQYIFDHGARYLDLADIS